METVPVAAVHIARASSSGRPRAQCSGGQYQVIAPAAGFKSGSADLIRADQPSVEWSRPNRYVGPTRATPAYCAAPMS